ncbi:MAG: SDR family oxidoreductase [Oscillospiraceae bacterium]|nr:SDR family oxidoreductase [Oscillospiraceae bacterium]
MNENLKGKVAVITGAGGTICSEVAIDLAKNGVKLALVGRTAEKLEKTEAAIKEIGGECFIFACDVCNSEKVEELADKVYETYGKCDFLVNGAGGNQNAAMPSITQFDEREIDGTLPDGIRGFYDIDMDCFENVIKINTMGSVLPIRAFAKRMARDGGGSIINFASMNSYCPLTRCFAYAMSKAAVVNMTQSFAAYFAPANIRINAIAPGFIANERSKQYLGTPEDGLTPRGQQVINHTPTKRFGKAHDICGCVRWLLDEEASSFVTGVTVPVDGGFLTLSGV